MAGSPFKDAWRARLATHRAALGYDTSWPIKDVDNTTEQPGVPTDAVQGYLELEFPGGQPERIATGGQPGNNLYDEVGPVTLRLVSRLRAGTTIRDAAEALGEGLRKRFREDRFLTSENRRIRVPGVSPLSEGHDEGGNFVWSVFMAYQIYNVG